MALAKSLVLKGRYIGAVSL